MQIAPARKDQSCIMGDHEVKRRVTIFTYTSG
jgi:hypothetical protein